MIRIHAMRPNDLGATFAVSTSNRRVLFLLKPGFMAVETSYGDGRSLAGTRNSVEGSWVIMTQSGLKVLESYRSFSSDTPWRRQMGLIAGYAELTDRPVDEETRAKVQGLLVLREKRPR